MLSQHAPFSPLCQDTRAIASKKYWYLCSGYCRDQFLKDSPYPLSFHTVRHTFAVLAINDGLTITVASRLLGHSSTDITEKVYAKLLPQTLTAEVERLHYSFLPSELS